MLAELRITNFALIDELSVSFAPGFQVLTGETGAGKSIIVDAIALLVGGRASSDQIRTGEDEAVLEAAFLLDEKHPMLLPLREQGLIPDGERELIVRRVLSRTGRNRLYVNGSLTPLHVLQQLAGTLIDIHGQHEQQSLLSPAVQLDAVDALGGLRDLRRQYVAQYERWRARQNELAEAERIAEQRREREDMLRFQHQELRDAGLREGEEAELTSERQRLSHGRRLAELSGEAYELLYEGDSALLNGVGIIASRLRDLVSIDASASEWTALIDEATAQLRELAQRVREYRHALNEDPDRLSRIEERLDRLQRLRKKYGGSEAAMLARLDQLAADVAALDQGDGAVADLRARLEADEQALTDIAGKLTEGRKASAQKLERRVKAELAALRMERTRLRVEVSAEGDGGFGPAGRDRIEFRFSANEGEPPQPLARVASGGELSRVMLALKTVLAETDHVPVLVFDEVDAGVGGAVASVMGERLRALGAFHQVFCITHLPQVASQATAHFRVSKDVVKKRTRTHVTKLDNAERRNEIARMLAGATVSASAKATAAELLGEAGR